MATQIDLSRPASGGYEGRGFGCHFVWKYLCNQGHTVRIRNSSFKGKNPVPGVGAIHCPQCEFAEKMAVMQSEPSIGGP